MAFKNLLEKDGIDAAILEPEDIAYDEGKLVRVEDGIQINLIYKRLLFDDIMNEKSFQSDPARSAGIAALERAYSENAVCMAPSMLSRMVGNKLLLALIKHSSFERRLNDIGLTLSDYERQVRDVNFPETHVWSDLPLQ